MRHIFTQHRKKLFNLRGKWLSVALLMLMVLLVISLSNASSTGLSDLQKEFRNPTGWLRTFSASGVIDTRNPFFQDLGTNGRTCATCHDAADAWSVTPAHVFQRYLDSDGSDPLFRPIDGATCPTDDVSTPLARTRAYKLLLTKGLIRVGLDIPKDAGFSLLSVDDPYHCSTPSGNLSMYRRPLPTTNLRFLSTVMWDGRETDQDWSITDDLAKQVVDATMGHAQAAHPPTDEQVKQIVQFETGIYTAQVRDDAAGYLAANGGVGGPFMLAEQRFFLGINDSMGRGPLAFPPFDPTVFTIYRRWQNDLLPARASIARGEHIFNNRIFTISGVGGLNDVLGKPEIEGTCTTCHNAPNVGNHSLSAPLNIGLADASRRTADLPLFTFQCNKTGDIIQTTDPGRAMISGKCKDLGKFKGAVLRGLAARAPYFHNGSAATLQEAVKFYNNRFSIGLTQQEKADLEAFLRTL